MLAKALTGVNPPLVTPFTPKDTIDEHAFRSLIRFCIDKLGVSGLMPAGSTGEFSSLSLEEHHQIIELCVDEANGKVATIAGTGTSGTKRTLEITQIAKDIGVDACAIVTPFYMKPSDQGLYKHYADIASKMDLPILLYNIPILSGVTLPQPVVERLATECSNIVGIKDSSGNMRYLMELLERVKPLRSDFKILCGWDEIAFPALAAGADGLILSTANFLADDWIQIKNAVDKESLGDARRLESQIHKITRIVNKTGASGVKMALNYMGIHVGDPRPPLEFEGDISSDLREALRKELEHLGKIPLP